VLCVVLCVVLLLVIVIVMLVIDWPFKRQTTTNLFVPIYVCKFTQNMTIGIYDTDIDIIVFFVVVFFSSYLRCLFVFVLSNFVLCLCCLCVCVFVCLCVCVFATVRERRKWEMSARSVGLSAQRKTSKSKESIMPYRIKVL
jgi:hypothetical protein